MITKKKQKPIAGEPGRPTEGALPSIRLNFTIPGELANMINEMPRGERSRFIARLAYHSPEAQRRGIPIPPSYL